MSCEDADTFAETAAANAAKPKRMKGDEGEVEMHSLPDQIAYEKWLRSKCAASSRKPGFGLRLTTLKPPGTA